MDNENMTKKERKAQIKAMPAIFPGAREKMLKIPVFLLVPIAYVIIGMLLHWWHPTWLMFFFIPIYYQLCVAVGTKTKRGFFLNLPVVPIIVCAYLTVSLTVGLWSYTWILFLLIPVYYWMAAFIKE